MDTKPNEERNIQELQSCISARYEAQQVQWHISLFHLGMLSWHSCGTWGTSSTGGAEKKLPTKQNP